MDPDFVSHDYEVTISEFGGKTLDYSVAPTHRTKAASYFAGKSYENKADILADVRDQMIEVAGLDLSQVPLIDYAFKHPDQAQNVASQYQRILEEMIQVKNEMNR